MPQIFPINWLVIMLLVMVFLMKFLVINYFFFKFENNLKFFNSKFMFKKMNLKW